MIETMTNLKRMARWLWRWLREWSGDAAYERYLKGSHHSGADSRVLTPAEFYVQLVNRKYSGPSRCC